jgi:hypothetical protein
VGKKDCIEALDIIAKGMPSFSPTSSVVVLPKEKAGERTS